ncbi:hypothetical protein CAOG_07869 [Capsaspora owczarzaki ATCC 30864]|uniref:Carbohydrate deacetylase n=1 Tax=Capsaspora owczarzaki (strain ATCC 30864) TaxID=595528 RepID=A0A0D2US22_CAPO3|nr:hypothetical protein CAOG_07869 [Capsaspora owczarzaki ATCC 30864]KJE97766.1 hypothetical protein CAOG_007869 [Capsaspora owczarzaki ATCC 30864]|eukprot:XP_004342954.1 hypothetical protein CAOG_07869 [Capsaspora owczarzaki ATCC 30864]
MEQRQRTLVVNADDLGIDAQRDLGIAQAIRNGVVRSASMIVNGASSESAAELFRRTDWPARVSIGLHLNLTEGRTIATPSLVRALLHESSEEMLGKFGFRDRLNEQLDGVIQATAIETRAQIQHFVMLMGSLPSHLDGHQHVHTIPELAETIAQICAEVGITRTRIPSDNMQVQPWMDTQTPRYKFLCMVAEQGRRSRAIYASHGVSSTTSFIGLGLMGLDFTIERMCERLGSCPDGTIEWMCHPGLSSTEGDDFNQSPDRPLELKWLCSTQLRETLSAERIEVDSFHVV